MSPVTMRNFGGVANDDATRFTRSMLSVESRTSSRAEPAIVEVKRPQRVHALNSTLGLASQTGITGIEPAVVLVIAPPTFGDRFAVGFSAAIPTICEAAGKIIPEDVPIFVREP